MKVLFISTDIKIFDPKSSVHERFLGFSSLGEEIHVVVVRPCNYDGVYKLSSNIFVYPTSKSNTLISLIKGFFAGLKILKNDKSSKWVISVQDPFEQGWVGYMLSKIFKKPLHVQIHTDMLSLFFLRNSFLDRMRVFLCSPIIRFASRIRVDALRIKDSIIKKYKVKEDMIDVLQIYIDVPKMINEAGEKMINEDYILYVGRFEKEKNVESIIKAFAKIYSSYPSLKLVLLGSGSLLENYQNLSKKLGVLDSLIVVPWTNNVGGYMKHAKALVLSSWFEGFALVLVEAILNGCPIITTDVGAVGGIIPREYANIFPQNDAKALAEEMVKVLNNYEKQKEKILLAKNDILGKIPKDIDSYTKIFKESLEKCI